MKVVVAFPNFVEDIKFLFGPDHHVEIFDFLSPQKEADLVVFSGGEDVSQELYAETYEEIEQYSNLVASLPHRDILEEIVFSHIIKNHSRFKKVLGICRGMQFLNVMLGGSLYQDLKILGLEHAKMHEIVHTEYSKIGELTSVNSRHHQGIKKIGAMNGKYMYKIWSVEPLTSIVEAIEWTPKIVKLPKIIGLQFHPEFFEFGENKSKYVRNVIEDWVHED